MTASRMSVPGQTIALTRRTTFRKAFLAPWDPEVAKLWLYCLALGQQAYDVAIHMTTLVPSHLRISLNVNAHLAAL